jgi:hypothetical protein
MGHGGFPGLCGRATLRFGVAWMHPRIPIDDPHGSFGKRLHSYGKSPSLIGNHPYIYNYIYMVGGLGSMI